MIKIQTLNDMKVLQSQKGSSVPSLPLLTYLEDYFRQLYEALSDGESLDEFSLEQHGYFVVLESDDNVRDLHEVGLNPKDKGLLECWPEYAERLKFDDGSEWVQLAILYDNDCMMLFFLQAKDFDKEVQAWISDQMEEVIPYSSSEQTASSTEE